MFIGCTPGAYPKNIWCVFTNGKESTVNRALGGSTYPG